MSIRGAVGAEEPGMPSPLAGTTHPTTVLLSVHKGASTFLAEHFGPAVTGVFPGMRHVVIGAELQRGRTLAELALPATGMIVSRVYPHLYDTIVEEPVPADGRFADKRLIMVRRDPRDVAVSLYYSVRYSHQPPPAGTEKSRRFHDRRALLQELDVVQGIERSTADTAIRQFLATVSFLNHHRHVCLAPYELLVTDFTAWLERVRHHLGWTAEQAGRIGEGLGSEVQPPAEEDPGRHKRRVRPGNWLEVFDDGLRDLFRRRLGSALTDAGYGW